MTVLPKCPRRKTGATVRSVGHSLSGFVQYPGGTSVSAFFASLEQKRPNDLKVRIRAMQRFTQSRCAMLMLKCARQLCVLKKTVCRAVKPSVRSQISVQKRIGPSWSASTQVLPIFANTKPLREDSSQLRPRGLRDVLNFRVQDTI